MYPMLFISLLEVGVDSRLIVTHCMREKQTPDAILPLQVCLALLRSDRDWIGGAGGIKSYPPDGEVCRVYAAIFVPTEEPPDLRPLCDERCQDIGAFMYLSQPFGADEHSAPLRGAILPPALAHRFQTPAGTSLPIRPSPIPYRPLEQPRKEIHTRVQSKARLQ